MRRLSWEARTTTQIAQVLLPSGDPVWVRLTAPDAAGSAGSSSRAEDVGLDIESLTPAKLPDFVDTIRGVIDSVRLALEEREPDLVSVEFGLEIAAKTGRFVSVLAEAGATAHIKATASWEQGARNDATGGRPSKATAK